MSPSLCERCCILCWHSIHVDIEESFTCPTPACRPWTCQTGGWSARYQLMLPSLLCFGRTGFPLLHVESMLQCMVTLRMMTFLFDGTAARGTRDTTCAGIRCTIIAFLFLSQSARESLVSTRSPCHNWFSIRISEPRSIFSYSQTSMELAAMEVGHHMRRLIP